MPHASGCYVLISLTISWTICSADVARFDNSHSWTKAKKLSYWLEMLQPSEEEPEFQEMDLDALKLND